MDLVKRKYGIAMQSFGAPFNCTDSVFTRVFEAQSMVKVMMYPNAQGPRNAFKLEREVNMEVATGKPDFAAFVAAYGKSKGREYYCLQGHPAAWTAGSAELGEFKRIVTYLKAEGLAFLTPFGYYQSKTGSVGLGKGPGRHTVRAGQGYAGASPVLRRAPGADQDDEVRVFNPLGQALQPLPPL